MACICDRCKRTVEKVVPVGDAEYSAQASGLIGVPYPQYEYLCPSCAVESLGISKGDLAGLQPLKGDIDELISDIQSQKDLMIAVATGGPRIQEKNPEYRERWGRIRKRLDKMGLEDPNPHSDLWQWYGRWSSGDLPTYQSRREYIANLYGGLEDHLEKRRLGTCAEPTIALTGWTRVDRGVDAIRARLETGKSEEEFQTVGLLCCETLISLAQCVYDPSRHGTVDGVNPSHTDAKRMLEAYFGVELRGGGDEAARKHAKGSLDLANELQHRRTAEFREAALCAEATRTVVNIVAIISGRVGR
jgi:hypothetical protein